MKNQNLKSLKYIDLTYAPTKNDVVAYYYLEPNKNYSLEEVADKVAGESSIDTWTSFWSLEPQIFENLKPSVFEINKEKSTIKIAYPSELFEGTSVPQILSALAGNIFGMKAVKNLRLIDILFPQKILKLYSGPAFGIKGIRQLLKVYERPLLGTIVKPKVGLSSAKHAKIAYAAWVGGLDIVKDDENLTSQSFNRFEERIEKTLNLRDKAEKETGEKKVYMANITAETKEMLRRADYVFSLGGEYVMIDFLTIGFAAFQTLKEHLNKRQVIHVHRAMHAAITKNPKHGISMQTLAKLVRMIGGDQLHVGTMGEGKMNNEEDQYSVETLRSKVTKECDGLLAQDWNFINPVMPVASGGLHPGKIPELIKKFGIDVVLQFGGGCHGHPSGTENGAKAIRSVCEGIIKGQSLEEIAKRNKDVNLALKKFSSEKSE
ncbi:MAG: type III ribulose-bisphosphate carboxylase [Candidatus Woesearchaeota archaeon]